MKRVMLAAALASALAGAVACGGGGGSKSTATSPSGTPAANVTVALGTVTVPIPGLQTATSDEKTVIATPYELSVYHHDATAGTQGTDIIDFPYDVSLPTGWHIDQTGVALVASLLRTDKFPYAGISLDCRPGVDKSQMLDLDSTSATKLNLGNLADVPRTTLQVAGSDAIRVDWVGGGTFPGNHVSVYVNGKSCAWRLQLNTFGAITPDEMSALFLRVVEAFNPAQGLP